jgi:hypothetical protein
LDVQSKYGSGSNPVHYRVVSSADGTTVSDGYNPLSARLLSAEDKKIRVILSEEDAEGGEIARSSETRHERGFLDEEVMSVHDLRRYPSLGSGTGPAPQLNTASAADVHGNIDTKSVFRSAFSPDEKSLVDDLNDLMAQEEGGREHSASSTSSGGMFGTSPGLSFPQGHSRAPIPSFPPQNSLPRGAASTTHQDQGRRLAPSILLH